MEGEFTFVGVMFENYPKIYHYLCEGKLLKPFDVVLVPAGKDNEVKFAVVCEVKKCTRENAPFPPERAKKVADDFPVEWMTPSVEFFKKCLYKPVKLVFPDFFNRSGVVKIVAETPDGKAFIRLANDDGEITVPIGNIKYAALLN